MLASVTLETWKVSTDDGTFPWAANTDFIGIPVLALIVSTCGAPPPNSADPAVRVSVGCPPAVESATVTWGIVASRRSTPARTCGLPAPSVSASTLFGGMPVGREQYRDPQQFSP
jgi:hypothetical protein